MPSRYTHSLLGKLVKSWAGWLPNDSLKLGDCLQSPHTTVLLIEARKALLGVSAGGEDAKLCLSDLLDLLVQLSLAVEKNDDELGLVRLGTSNLSSKRIARLYRSVRGLAQSLLNVNSWVEFLDRRVLVWDIGT